MNIKSIIKNKVVFYLASRYATYGIQFLCSLLIASKLGPYYMGIWGFILLILQYFEHFHFGIASSFNVLYVQNRYDEKVRNNYTCNALILILLLGVVSSVFYIAYQLVYPGVFNKYELGSLSYLICIVAIFQYLQTFLTNLFRVRNQLWAVTVTQSLVTLLTFLCVIILDGKTLLMGLIFSYLIAYIASLIIAKISKAIPHIKECDINYALQKTIISKGLMLFLYNTCFYFIIISIRTFVSSNYSVKEFGMFTFSFTIAHAFLLLLQSVTFLVFPKLLGKLAEQDNTSVSNNLARYRDLNISSSYIMILSSLMAFPLIVKIMPDYENAQLCMEMVALSILMQTGSTGFTELLIAKNKEGISAVISLTSLVLNVLVALILIKVIKLNYDLVIISAMVTYLYFSVMAAFFGKKQIGNASLSDSIKEVLPFRYFLPYIAAIVVCVIGIDLFLPLPLILFSLLNIQSIKNIFTMVKKLLYNPNLVNL